MGPEQLAQVVTQSPAVPRYQLTPRDANWALRAAVYEGGDPAYTLWTMLQRWVLFRERGFKGDFAAFIRAFSQPVNPKWARGGQFCGSGGKYAGSKFCSESRLRRRERAQTLPLQQIRALAPDRFDRASAWLEGRVANPVPRSTDFGDPGVARSALRKNPKLKVVAAPDNVFLAMPEAQSWPRNYVQLVGPGNYIADADGARRRGGLRAFALGLRSSITRWWA